MFIVSGSDETELNRLCRELEIAHYFKLIKGSPTPKKELVGTILNDQEINSRDCILIGDSINDFDAAKQNLIDFYGYNNADLKGLGKSYINSFEEII